jgi:hypothetical protein
MALKLLRTSVGISVFVIVASSSALAQTPPGWKTYVDKVHGFSFAYPPLYKLKRRPDSNRDQEEDAREGGMDKAALEGRWVGLRNQRSDGTIDFRLTSTPFNLDGLSSNAPTGQEGPPPAAQEGESTFYYYGAGGGGVEYPDQFFYNFRGKTLYIVFDGPYTDKSPTDETKEIESKMLASFRTFAPKRIR